MLAAWLVLGVALLVGNGAGPLGLPAVILAAALTWRGDTNARRIDLVIVAAALIGLARPPGLYAEGRFLIEAVQLAVALLVLRRHLFLAVALYLVAGALLLHASPHPTIDVFHLQQEGSATLLHGHNPYAAQFTNPYSESERLAFLGSSSPFLEHYPYPPLSLLVTTASYFIAGDVRWAMLLAQAAIALLLARLAGNKSLGNALGGLSLLHPRGLFVLEQAWTEPLVAAAFLLVMVLRQNTVAFGFFLTMKQYAILFLPLVRRWKALAVAALITVPFLVWDPHAFFDDLVWFQVRQPFRMDALSLLPPIAWLTGWRAPSWIAIFPVAAVFLWRKLPPGPMAIPLGGALASFAFLLFAKQAFCNYYYFVGVLLLAAIALGSGANEANASVQASPSGENPSSR